MQTIIDVVRGSAGIGAVRIKLLKALKSFKSLLGGTLVSVDRIDPVIITAPDLIEYVWNGLVAGMQFSKALVRRDGLIVFFEIIMRVGNFQLGHNDIAAERIPVFELLKFGQGFLIILLVVFFHARDCQLVGRFRFNLVFEN